MNILPKKRWHVRTKDNIARVRKDEAEAREEEKKKSEKLKLAESEARVNFLRTRSGLTEKERTVQVEENTINKDECSHINLFADYKTHVKSTNEEQEKEKKEEQEKYEKKIGYLTYLGQDTNEALRLKSWYEIAPKRVDPGTESSEVNEKDLKIKHNHDPLTLINSLLPSDTKSIVKPTFKRKRIESPTSTKEETKLDKKHKDHKKHKKSKHKKRSKNQRREMNNVEDELLKRSKLEHLRKERLRREASERARQEILLAPKECTKVPDTSKSTSKITQKYNSQFNPELAKQNIT